MLKYLVLHDPSKLVECTILSSVLIGFEEISSYGQFNSNSIFSDFSSVTINRQFRMTLVSFVRTTESYEICRWIIRGLPIGSPFGSIFTEAGGLHYMFRINKDCAGLHNCYSCFLILA